MSPIKSNEYENGNINSWTQWGKYVLKTIENISNKVESVQQDIIDIKSTASETKFSIKEEIRKEVADEFEKIKENLKDLEKDIKEIDRYMVAQKVKAAILGSIGTLIVSVGITLLIHLVKTAMGF